MENCSSIAFSSTAFSISFTSSSAVISVTESCASAGSAPASAVTLTVVFPTAWLHYCMWGFMVYDRVFEIGPVDPIIYRRNSFFITLSFYSDL